MEGMNHFINLIGGGAVRRHQNENISDRTSEQAELAVSTLAPILREAAARPAVAA